MDTDEQTRRMQARMRETIFGAIGEEALVDMLVHECLPMGKGCEALLEQERLPIGLAAKVLTEHGGLLTLDLMHRSRVQGASWGWREERVLEHQLTSSPRFATCRAPEDEEVARMRRQLSDFVVIDAKRAGFVARQPTHDELNDLAYFMVAVEDAGPAVGDRYPGEVDSIQCPAAVEPEQIATLRDLNTRIDAAAGSQHREDLAEAERAYLVHLGYPGTIDVCRDGRFEWTGSWHSELMRDLASQLESLGEVEEAEALYRRANPGGGACGVGEDWRRKWQLKGVIRSGERAHGCRRVVPERLLDVHEGYGVGRLMDAGFDLARLYRGALVSRNRDQDAQSLQAILSALPKELAGPALRRLGKRGSEAWEQRVYGLEGLADTLQRPAIDTILALLPELGGPSRIRALRALGKLARRFVADPCTGDRWLTVHDAYERNIRMLGRECSTRLNDTEAEALSRRVAPWLADPDVHVRSAAAETLGRIGSSWSRPVLQRVAAHDPGFLGLVGTGNGWQPNFPAREAAKQALADIDSVYDPESR